MKSTMDPAATSAPERAYVSSVSVRWRAIGASGDAGRPVAMEPVGHAMRQADAGHGLAGDVPGVEDEEVAAVAGSIVAEGEDPAVVLGRALGAGHEDGLADAVQRAEGPRLAPAAVEIVLADGGPERKAA